ncbi:hypothetical protein SDJN02_25082, partial [Cucurbita argyrosperma subsp. argyrosperma]
MVHRSVAVVSNRGVYQEGYASLALRFSFSRRPVLPSKSEKFPPPHQDGAVGYPPHETSQRGHSSFGAADASFSSSIFSSKSESIKTTGAPEGPSRRKRTNRDTSSRKFMRALKPSIGLSMDLLFR